MEDLTHVHPILKNVFFKLKIPKSVLAGRIKEVLPAWKLLTKDQELLALVGGYQIPLLMEPLQEKAPKVLAAKASRSGSEGNAGKGFHFKSLSLKRDSLSSLFLISKEGGGNQPVINWKDLNLFIP